MRTLLRNTLLSAALLFALQACQSPAADSESSEMAEMAAQDMHEGHQLEGRWIFVRRELPDGTIVTSPDMTGVMDFHDGLRNFNVAWAAPDDQIGWYSVIAEYEIDSTDYRERRLFHSGRVPSQSPDLGVALADGEWSSGTLVETEGQITVNMPNDPPTLVFSGDEMTATLEGAFIDYWQRAE